MENEFDRCYFCKLNDKLGGCDWDSCIVEFEPNHDKIIKKAKEKDISVADVIALMNIGIPEI